jgi:phosphoglycolate phosphatase-like HAD superfamily hydrolase
LASELPLLALFDVDGTLFLTHDALSEQALRETLGARYGVSLGPDALDRVDHRGQTALRIAREVLRAEGVADDAIDEHLSAWCDSFTARYVDLLAGADTRDWQAARGAGAALSGLQQAGVRLALLTGNPERMARARMERLGLAHFFPAGQGAFGCDAEDRSDLIELARERAGGWPAAATVAVGDTERDVRSAHRSGIRVIAVRSWRNAGALAAADALCEDLDCAATALLAWAG